MSQQDVREFLDRLTADEGLREQVASTLEDSERDPDVVMDAARGLGLEFSLGELDEALAERYGIPAGELNDAELETVAGGMFPASTSGGGMCLAFPDVCKTPVPIIGAPPTPYPNIGRDSGTTTDSTKQSTTKG